MGRRCRRSSRPAGPAELALCAREGAAGARSTRLRVVLRLLVGLLLRLRRRERRLVGRNRRPDRVVGLLIGGKLGLVELLLIEVPLLLASIDPKLLLGLRDRHRGGLAVHLLVGRGGRDTGLGVRNARLGGLQRQQRLRVGRLGLLVRRLQLRIGGAERRLGLVHRELRGLGVDLAEHLALGDLLAGLDVDGGDLATRDEVHVQRLRRLDVAGRRRRREHDPRCATAVRVTDAEDELVAEPTVSAAATPSATRIATSTRFVLLLGIRSSPGRSGPRPPVSPSCMNAS